MFLFARFFAFLISIATCQLVVQGQTNPFESSIREFEQADLRNPPPTNSLLFLGSSTIVRWDTLEAAFPRFNVLNRGFGGSQASDVLYFYDRIVPPYHPPLIVFYEGDNDLAGGKSVDQVFADWTNFVGRVQADLPDSHILFVSVKPSPSRTSILPQQRALNDRVKEYTTGNPKLHYADVFNAMLDSSGKTRPELYVSDQLHLSPAGYEIWESVIVPAVEEWAANYPVNVLKAERNGLLIDFGSQNSLSGLPDQTVLHWNNVTSVALTSNGSMSNLVTSGGLKSGVSLEMISRFNGVNENGTAASTLFPDTATRDSLYGNTESFNGLQNITPIFKLKGLNPSATYRIQFYASRMGVSDNRETRYTVTGATVETTVFNVANNIESSVSISPILPDAAGELKIALTPGSNNNNANHFTYLGVLQVESLEPSGPKFLFDFGGSTSLTGTQAPAPGEVWNNLLPSTGATDDGALENLVAKNGTVTPIALRMLSRFNAPNENGTQLSTNFPATASADSLYGNTESFNEHANITPRFKLTGLNPEGIYALTFYASRTGVGDNRETRYTVTGATTQTADLNAANNVDNTAVVQNMRPNQSGEIQVDLSPGPNNNNANHFTYLGVLKLDWVIEAPRGSSFESPSLGTDGKVQVQFKGETGGSYRLETSVDLLNWAEETIIHMEEASAPLEFEASGEARFFRAIKL